MLTPQPSLLGRNSLLPYITSDWPTAILAGATVTATASVMSPGCWSAAHSGSPYSVDMVTGDAGILHLMHLWFHLLLVPLTTPTSETRWVVSSLEFPVSLLNLPTQCSCSIRNCMHISADKKHRHYFLLSQYSISLGNLASRHPLLSLWKNVGRNTHSILDLLPSIKPRQTSQKKLSAVFIHKSHFQRFLTMVISTALHCEQTGPWGAPCPFLS